jgi:hypothetical protein
MSFKIMNDGGEDYEVWICDTCKYRIILYGVGSDVAECPRCISNEYQNEH